MKLINTLIPAVLILSLLPSCKKLERIMAVQTLSVNPTTWIAKGAVIDVGDATPKYGFCWSLTTSPDFNDATVELGTATSPKSFEAALQGVIPGYKYYVRAYVKTSSGTVWGNEISFTATSGEVDYYWDDGVEDNSWRINPNYTGSLGNEFPVTTTGVITSVKLFFHQGSDDGNGTLRVDFYNSGKTYIDGLPEFYPPANSWITLSANVSFSGTFYAMVYWKNSTEKTKYLGIDENGPNAWCDYEWHYSSAGWKKLSASSNPGIFLIHVTAILYSDESIPQLIEIGPGKSVPQPLPASLQSAY